MHDFDNTCTFCNRPYSESQPAVLVPNTKTVYGHQGCINASTIGMKAVVVSVPAPGSVEDLLVQARTKLDVVLDRLHPEDCREVLEAQTLINEAIPRLGESIDLVLGA